jgi:hypothetical protein
VKARKITHTRPRTEIHDETVRSLSSCRPGEEPGPLSAMDTGFCQVTGFRNYGATDQFLSHALHPYFGLHFHLCVSQGFMFKCSQKHLDKYHKRLEIPVFATLFLP